MGVRDPLLRGRFLLQATVGENSKNQEKKEGYAKRNGPFASRGHGIGQGPVNYGSGRVRLFSVTRFSCDLETTLFCRSSQDNEDTHMKSAVNE